MPSPTSSPASEFRLDALMPAEMALKAEEIGQRKANAPFFYLLVLSILAGAFIALGGNFAITVTSGLAAAGYPYGIIRALFGLAFCLGLILVVVGGAELFTGNTLIVMAWASRKIKLMALVRNWSIVYLGNAIGSIGTALLIVLGKYYTNGGGAIGNNMLSIAAYKTHIEFGPAIALGILCNALVCLAVWLTYSARTTGDKILATLFPITAFAAAGFEHSVANMFFLPVAMLIQAFDPAFVVASGIDLSSVTLFNVLVGNLLPVTIGNIIGGSVLVGGVYWLVYLRGRK
jgi:formate transporter